MVMSEETTKSLSSTTDSKKKKKRYVYLEKFKSLESEVVDQKEYISELQQSVKNLHIVLGVLVFMIATLIVKVFIG